MVAAMQDDLLELNTVEEKEITWDDVCTTGENIILFTDTFYSKSRLIVKVIEFNAQEHKIITSCPIKDRKPHVVELGCKLVGQISIIEGAARFYMILESITEDNKFVFTVPDNFITIKHHNSLRINIKFKGTITNINGTLVCEINEPCDGNLSNSGVRLILDKIDLKLNSRYFINGELNYDFLEKFDKSYKLDCKFCISRLRDFVSDDIDKIEVAGFFIIDTKIRTKLEKFISNYPRKTC